MMLRQETSNTFCDEHSNVCMPSQIGLTHTRGGQVGCRGEFVKFKCERSKCGLKHIAVSSRTRCGENATPNGRAQPPCE